MDSIFTSLEPDHYWIQVTGHFQASLTEYPAPFSLKTKKFSTMHEKFYKLTATELIELDFTKNPARYTPIQLKLFQPFILQSPSKPIFGFKLGSKDFFVENPSEFDDLVTFFRKFCVLDSFDEDFVRIKTLGSGSSSTVYLVEDLQARKPFAAKSLTKNFLLSCRSGLRNLAQEIEILFLLDHPSIAQLYNVYETNDEVVLVMEYLPNGDLYRRMMKKKSFSVETSSAFAKNLLEVLEYLHSKNIVHRDLKPENLMMASEDDLSFKVIDFGLAYKSSEPQSHKCGSPGYLAPEILSKPHYTHKIDIFSAGVIVYTLLTGAHPFNGSSPQKVLNANMKCKFLTSGLKGQSKDFVLLMLEKNPKIRPESGQLLEHPWVFPKRRESVSVNLAGCSTLAVSLVLGN